MKKKILFTAVVMILVCIMTVCVSAAYSGTCGDNLTWVLDDEGTLTISGTGYMWEWWYLVDTPWQPYWDSIKTVIIEDGVTSIGYGAFNGCSSLTNVEIPDSITSINLLAFLACDKLERISVDNENKHYLNDEIGVLFDKDKTMLIQYPVGNMVTTSYEIPNSVKCIGFYSFSGSTNLTTITIPTSVESIEDYAFYFCFNLKSVTILNREAAIGSNVFWGCSPDLVLHGYAGSTTEAYANENGIAFVALEEVSENIEAKEAVIKEIWEGVKAPMFAVNFKIEATEYGFVGTVRNENGVATGGFHVKSDNVVIAKATGVDTSRAITAIISGIPTVLEEEVTIAVRAYYVINGHYFYGPIVEKTLGVNWAK